MKAQLGYEEPEAELDHVVLDEEQISSTVRRLGREINADYRGKELLVVGVLNGASVLTCDLVRQLEVPVLLDFLALRTYSPQQKAASRVAITKDTDADVAGAHLLIIEDIVDTGLSLHYLCRQLQARKPASLRIATLLDRPKLRLVDLPIAYRGFEVDDHFLVGYGLDFQGYYRNLPYVAALKSSVLPREPACA